MVWAGFAEPFKKVAKGDLRGFLPGMPDDEEEALGGANRVESPL